MTGKRCFVFLLVSLLLLYPEWKTLWAWMLFTLYLEMIAAVQVLLMALFENAAAAMLPVIFVQLVSMLLSQSFPGTLALLLPGNWGALARTTEFEVPDSLGRIHGGLPLWTAVALNLAVLLLICLFGWRFVRRKNMKR